MKLSWGWAIGFAWLLGLGAMGIRASERREWRKVLLVGDSHVGGLHGPLARIGTQEGFRVEWSGVNGSRIDQWAPRIASDLAVYAPFAPELLLVSLGTNDAAMMVLDPMMMRAHILAIASAARDRGIDLRWIGPPHLPARLEKASTVRELLRDTLGERFVDSSEFTFARSPDGVHATAGGYADWMTQAWNRIRR